MSCALTQSLIVQQFTESIDLGSRQVLNKISSLMLSQIIQSVKQTRNSYGDQVHLPSIMPLEASKTDNLAAAQLLLYVIAYGGYIGPGSTHLSPIHPLMLQMSIVDQAENRVQFHNHQYIFGYLCQSYLNLRYRFV